MATFNGNGIYLTIDSVNVSAYWTELTLDRSGDSVDVTAGSGSTHRARNPGLKDTSISFKVVYDDAQITTFIAKLDTGQAYTIIVGPEGNTGGKPKHEQSFVIESVSVAQGVEKPMVGFDVSASGAAAPTTDLFSGGTF